MGKHIGILTAGGDSPGLNAAIRAIGKAARSFPDTDVIGFRDGFRGMMENRSVRLNTEMLSGILTIGGTIFGNQPRQTAPDAGGRQTPGHDRCDCRQL